MDFQTLSLHCVYPEMIVLTLACVALIAELFFKRLGQDIAYYIVQSALVLSAVTIVAQFSYAHISLFQGHYRFDALSQLLQCVIVLAAFTVFVYSRRYIADRDLPSAEYYILGLFSVLGMMIMVAAQSLLTIYLGLELLSLPLYAMVALKRDDGIATEAALKYFLTGAIASAMLLYGMSMVYGATGQLELSAIANVLSTLPQTEWLMLQFGLVFLLVGIGFKFSAVPFHMWAPDVYAGAPSSVTLFLGSVPKLAALGMAIRLLLVAMPQLHLYWQQILIVLSILSMGLGNLMAMAQSNIKRLFAYSAIAHIGYMFLGFLTVTPEGYSASLFYIIAYVIMSLSALGLVVLMSKKGFEAENLQDYKGLNSRSPWLAFLMLITLFSMAGIPPTVGFFAKLWVIKSLIAAQFISLAVVAMLFAIMGTFYYIRIIKLMYFDTPDTASSILITAENKVLYSFNALLLLALGISPSMLMMLCSRVMQGF